jgi:hypothetical protein
MEFRLYYRGPLKSNGGVVEKQKIRRVFHAQLKKLWSQEPLNEYAGGEGKYLNYLTEDDNDAGEGASIIYSLSGFKFACLITERLKLHAEIDILFLRPEPSGYIIHTGGGDIDNRLKTLFDSLRQPLSTNEIPTGDVPGAEELPFHCLLSDDVLISKVAVTTDQLLNANSIDEVVLVIHVRIKGRSTTFGNLGLIS